MTWLIVGLLALGISASGCAKTVKDVAPVFTRAGWYNMSVKEDDGEPVTQYSLWVAEVDSDHTAAQHYAETMAPHPGTLQICIVPNLSLYSYQWSMLIRETDEAGTIKDGKVLDSYENFLYTRLYGNSYDCWTTQMLPAVWYRIQVTKFWYDEAK